MGLTFREEIYLASIQKFRVVVPLPEDRIPWSLATLPYAFIPVVLFLFMSYLVRRRDTYGTRLLLLPSIIITSVHVAYGYYFTDPRINVYNWGQSILASFVIAKSLDFGFSQEGMLKFGETKLPVIGGDVTDEPSPTIKKHRSQRLPLPSWIYDPLEVIFAIRGIGWKFGNGVYIPRETRSLGRGLFLRSTFVMFIKNFLIFDFLESCIKLLPGVGSLEGGSIFYPELPAAQRYTISTMIHICTGSCIIAGFYMVYHLFTIISVGLLGHLPLSWPPLMDHPFSSDSLNIFWSKRWHQVLRRAFVVFGGNPGYYITGKSHIGMVFGTFVASGMYHELTIYTMGKGLDHSITLFFVWQAFGVVLERLWKNVTGYKVQGWLGLVWVYFSIMVVGQQCIDAWHLRGLGGGLIIPPVISPTRRLLWPTLEYFLDTFAQ